MINKISFIFIWVFLFVNTAFGISVESVLKENISKNIQVKKSKIILTKKELKKVQQKAKVSLKTRLYRMYEVSKGLETIGYGILITRKVRSKKATVLYYISKKGMLEFTEILSFLEPREFYPHVQWMSQFIHVKKDALLKLGNDIPTISGATLSARNVVQGARVARAIVEVKFK